MRLKRPADPAMHPPSTRFPTCASERGESGTMETRGLGRLLDLERTAVPSSDTARLRRSTHSPSAASSRSNEGVRVTLSSGLSPPIRDDAMLEEGIRQSSREAVDSRAVGHHPSQSESMRSHRAIDAYRRTEASVTGERFRIRV
jgi:hypothetical protein